MSLKIAVACATAVMIAVGFQLHSSFRHSSARHERVLPDGQDKPGWKLTFDDEFATDRSLDRSKWMTSYRGGVRTHVPLISHEMEYFADDSVRLENGSLRLVADRKPMGGMDYTSGMICSADSFEQRFGLYELRAKLPKGRGFWSAFWLRNKRAPYYEIDVFEVIGQHSGVVHQTNHFPDEKTGKVIHITEDYNGPDTSDGFHTYSLDWEPDSLTWYVDGVQTGKHTRGVPPMPMYVIVNLAVGGNWPGPPSDDTPFPQSMDLQWLRVYKKA